MIYKNSLPIGSLSLALLLTLSLVSNASTMAGVENKSIYTTKKHKVTYEPPQGNRPKESVGGASRGDRCPTDSLEQNLPLTPLLPTDSPSLTLETHPTLLVYVPETSAKTALLSVRDASEDYDYLTTVPISDHAGIISLTLPDDAPALEVNREYKWSLSLLCDNKLRPDSPVTQGDILRVARNRTLSDELAQADLLESAAIYASAGLWYDTVSSLAKLKSVEPQDSEVSANWEGLLTSVGLENIAKAKFVE